MNPSGNAISTSAIPPSLPRNPPSRASISRSARLTPRSAAAQRLLGARALVGAELDRIEVAKEQDRALRLVGRHQRQHARAFIERDHGIALGAQLVRDVERGAAR